MGQAFVVRGRGKGVPPYRLTPEIKHTPLVEFQSRFFSAMGRVQTPREASMEMSRHEVCPKPQLLFLRPRDFEKASSEIHCNGVSYFVCRTAWLVIPRGVV